MLANNLSLDEEEAVQEELRELQALTASSPFITVVVPWLILLQGLEVDTEQVPRLPNVPDTEPTRVKTPGTVTFIFCMGELWLTTHLRTASGGISSGEGARPRISLTIFIQGFSICNNEHVCT